MQPPENRLSPANGEDSGAPQGTRELAVLGFEDL
jgi:hypothetical protein